MSANSVTLAEIQSADWSLTLDSTALSGQPVQATGAGIGRVVQGYGDVEQCLVIILTTPKGSDVLRPTFGCDLWRFIDRPLNLAIPHIVREVTDAITQWEPRAKLISISVAAGTGSQALSQRIVTINWQLQLAGAAAPVQSINIPFAVGAGA